jgi:hypothetical protein
VAEDFLKGFMLKDRVVRCAKVKVFMPGDGALNDAEQAPEHPESGEQRPDSGAGAFK